MSALAETGTQITVSTEEFRGSPWIVINVERRSGKTRRMWLTQANASELATLITRELHAGVTVTRK